MEMLLNLIIYFFIYSFLGWVLESVYKSFLEKKLVNSGFLFGPICPIYGFGAIIMYLFLEDVSSKPVIAFCLGFVILSIWEYIVGMVLEKIFHTKYWDYSKDKFNLQGRVCLKNSIFWGILGVVFIDVIHPFVIELLNQVSSDLIMYIDITFLLILFIDIIVSVKNTISIADKLKRVEELNRRIKEKAEEIKEKGKNFEIKNVSLQDALDELKEKKDMITEKSYKSINRLKKAFPTLKSEQITNFLNERKEIFKNNKN